MQPTGLPGDPQTISPASSTAVPRSAAKGEGQRPKVNQLTFTKSSG